MKKQVSIQGQIELDFSMNFRKDLIAKAAAKAREQKAKMAAATEEDEMLDSLDEMTRVSESELTGRSWYAVSEY